MPPQGAGWQLCDGTATQYLTMGSTLTETAFTVPDLISTPAYRKSVGTYTGTIHAKSGTTGTANTGTGTTGTGTTSTGTTGTGTTGTGTTGGGTAPTSDVNYTASGSAISRCNRAQGKVTCGRRTVLVTPSMC